MGEPVGRATFCFTIVAVLVDLVQSRYAPKGMSRNLLLMN